MKIPKGLFPRTKTEFSPVFLFLFISWRRRRDNLLSGAERPCCDKPTLILPSSRYHARIGGGLDSESWALWQNKISSSWWIRATTSSKWSAPIWWTNISTVHPAKCFLRLGELTHIFCPPPFPVRYYGGGRKAEKITVSTSLNSAKILNGFIHCDV